MKYLFLAIIILLGNTLYAQPQNANWTFGNYNGVKFLENGVLQHYQSQVTVGEFSAYQRECVATISDSLRNLLFYFYAYNTRAAKLMNADHQLIQNGDSLNANLSATNGTVIVPKPNNPYFYYLYTRGGYGGTLKNISSKH